MHLFSKKYIKEDNFNPGIRGKFIRTQSLREDADYEIMVNIDQSIAKEKL